MKKSISIPVLLFCCLAFAFPAFAHFGMVIPSDSVIMQGDSRTVTLKLSFSHPFEGIGMDLKRPHRFSVLAGGRRADLKDRLKAIKLMDHSAWEAKFDIKRPGVYQFYMEPQPYFESAEDRFIIHYTKTVVAAFGDDDRWDAAAGLKTEIVPLSRPFALYAGNVFQGMVQLDGKPVPHARVEVEFYNRTGNAKAPNDLMIAQTVKADARGVFTYAPPRAGWWGFAALSRADFTLDREGIPKEVELGAVLWVEFHDWIE